MQDIVPTPNCNIQDQSFKDRLTKPKFQGHIINIFTCIVIALNVAKMLGEPHISCKIMNQV